MRLSIHSSVSLRHTQASYKCVLRKALKWALDHLSIIWQVFQFKIIPFRGVRYKVVNESMLLYFYRF